MESFNNIIRSGQPVLVDFFAVPIAIGRCGPCKAMAPVLKNFSSELNGKARILKVDIDKNPAVASACGIQAVPTLLLFKNGEVKWRQSGIVSGSLLMEIISKFSV